jgi:hypothetical protein
MSRPSYFYRNARAGELLELFLVSAVTSLLTVRFFLHLTGYPSVGGARFHIAHMLYGGLLMVAALVLLMAFIGSRVQRLASVIGGLGFGLFIDELGKFITRDNNYFFQPTIALIYIVFMLLFVLFRLLSRTRRLSPNEYLLNAITLIEEVALDDLDRNERQRALRYLAKADPKDPLVAPLRQALLKTPPVNQHPGWLQRWRRAVERTYERLIATRFGVTVIDAVFIGKAAVFLVAIGLDVAHLASHQFGTNVGHAALLQLASSLLSAGLVVIGATQIRRSRLVAYDYFTKSLLIDIFVTQFFAFYRYQFAALPGFALNLMLYVTIRILRHQESHLQSRRS